MFELIGYWLCVILGLTSLSGLTAVVAYANVKAINYLVKSTMGWKNFYLFAEWYRENKSKKECMK